MRRVPLALAALLLAAAAPAAAQTPIIHEDRSWSSPQSWALELRLGPYYPAVDSEFSGPAEDRPHRRYFGDKPRLLFQVELDYQFFDRFGTAAVGVFGGYFRETAKAFVETGAGVPSTERSGDSTSLTLWPLGAVAVYRFDVAARRWGVPLVPYAKAGLTWTIWSIADGNGRTASSEMPKGKGRGVTRGWLGAVGLALQLDFLDPTAARSMDADVGVNHTYLFIEGFHHAASGLGGADALHVGDTTWTAGLLFEF